jgi:hypothetical protein
VSRLGLDVARRVCQKHLVRGRWLDLLLVVFFAWSAGSTTYTLHEAFVCLRDGRRYRLRVTWWVEHEEVDPRWMVWSGLVNLVLTVAFLIALQLGLYDVIGAVLDAWLD